MSDVLLWVDCEMTGLDVEKEEICEIALVPTDFSLVPLDPGRDFVIRPSRAALEGMGEFVRSMHTKNGLLPLLDSARPLKEVKGEILAYASGFVSREHKGYLAGNTIGSDKKFIDKYLPELSAMLSYRTVDVSSIKELCRRWYPEAFASKPVKHGDDRSLADIIESIDELKYYTRTIVRPESFGEARAQVEASSLLKTWQAKGVRLVDYSNITKKD
ncbi:MAG: oligoribonuclease [Aeriscardovia sp.]|nr:oligoribonuclease [Aeriscardovia sp.]